jgi:hypothetical protein
VVVPEPVVVVVVVGAVVVVVVVGVISPPPPTAPADNGSRRANAVDATAVAVTAPTRTSDALVIRMSLHFPPRPHRLRASYCMEATILVMTTP